MRLFFEDFPSWLQGMLFILIAYHTVSYFFTKDKSFAIYAGYLVLLTIYLIPRTNNESSNFIAQKFSSFFIDFNWVIQIWYWMLYTWFSIHFLNLTAKNQKLAKQIELYIITTLLISSVFFLLDLFLFKGVYMPKFFMIIYTPISLLIISFFLKVIYQFKDKINKFFVIGLVCFLGFSLLSLILSIYKKIIFNIIHPIDFFMIGVLLEAITISIGLGYKYHIYRQESSRYNMLLIDELKKNEILKDQLNEKLSEKVESHRIAELEALYKNQINELKLTSLLSQMNPHFIFNALNSIKLYVINNDSKIAAYYLNKFSKLIRKILEASKNKESTLQEELETMDLYMSIENIRFSNEINFSINADVNIDLQKIKVPPLVLQPFLENSIWHGLSSKKGDKEITITIDKVDNSFVLINIKDNGIGRNAAQKIKADKVVNRKSLGIQITKDRLANFVKEMKNSFEINYVDLVNKNKTNIGTEVTLKIPLL